MDIRSELERHRSIVKEYTTRETTLRSELTTIKTSHADLDAAVAIANRKLATSEAAARSLRDKIVRGHRGWVLQGIVVENRACV